MNVDEVGLARVLDAALTNCIHNGNTTADEIAQATRFDQILVDAALSILVVRGALIARLGGVFARPLVRQVRLPGESYVSDLKPSIAALMGARG